MRYNIVKNLQKVSCRLSKFSSQASSLDIAHSKAIDQVTYENQFDCLNQSVTPLSSLPYDEQLDFKQNFTKSVVGMIYQKKAVPKFKTDIRRIIPSPIIEGYRNKDDFSVNTGVDGDSKTVGFYIGAPSNGQVVCVPPTKLVNIKKRHIELSQLYQEFIRVSPLRACHLLHDGGFWRNLIVRSNRKGDTMVIVIVHPNGASEEHTLEAMHQFADFFSGQDISSIYYQSCPHTRCSNTMAPYKLLHGKKYLYEQLGQYKFQISPDSFFQVNSAAAEILYSKVLVMADVTIRSTLLDLCSGIGTMSIFANSEVRGCIGIEVLEEAVKDAKHNATLNNVTNCHFVSGSIEKRLKNVLKELDCSPDIIGILNPGRSGVLKSAIISLRNCSALRTLIYISCKADNRFTQNNFHDLMDPKLNDSPPFILTHVQPVDMFPHTKHCELIMVFNR